MKTITQYFRSIPLPWSRFGRTMLFSLALFVSPYLPLGLVEPQGSRIWLTVAYFYPALVVVWGLWKSHSVIGWSVMGIHGFNIVTFMVIALLLDQSAQNSAHEVSTWPTYYWQHIALIPFTATGLVYVFSFWGLIAIIFFWRLDRGVPPPVAIRQDSREILGHRSQPRSGKQRSTLLLVGAVVGVFLIVLLTIWLSLIFLEGRDIVFFHFVAGTHWLIWPASVLEEFYPIFHMVSVTVLGLLIVLGLVKQRSDIVEAACWLLLPGQLLTIVLLPMMPLATIVGTLVMLTLGLLVQWHYGFPLTLLLSRRGSPSPVTG